MLIQRMGHLGFQAILHLGAPSNPPHLISIGVHDRYLQIAGNIPRFLELAERLYGIFSPIQGDIEHSEDKRRKTVVDILMKIGNRTVRAERHLPLDPSKGLPGVYWANFLGPVFVNFFSRELIESAPVFQKKRLSDGGYLILTSGSPMDYSLPENKNLEQALVEHLGKDAIFDKSDPDRILRSPFPAQPKGNELTGVQMGSSQAQKGNGKVPVCPQCGEIQQIEEISRNPISSLVGFRCLRCRMAFAVHTYLLN